jgi:hypothetical protein
MRAERLRRAYLAVAVLWLNLCLSLALLNLLALALPERPAAAPFGPAGDSQVHRAYPLLGPGEIERLLRESVRDFVYEPYTQFRERPFAGRYVNVDVHGFRVGRNQGPWPPDRRHLNVLVFGGSTTFSYGVADEDTVASHLQARLQTLRPPREVRVYNFGRGAYYSTQERVLFEKLLAEGVRPDLAVFVDGLNDFFFYDDRPAWTPVLEEVVAQSGRAGGSPYLAALRALPASRRIAAWLPAPDVREAMAPARAPRADDAALIERVLERYLANQRLIEAAAEAHGVRAFFVWQPVPTYRYPPADREPAQRYGRHAYSRFGYPRMAALREAGRAGDLLWCADLHGDGSGLLYVDLVHYSPRMAERLARCIADGLRERRALP